MTDAVNISGEPPAVIDQLNLGFDADQDRLLFRVGLSDNTELVVWLTRRVTKSIWTWLKTSQEALLDELALLVRLLLAPRKISLEYQRLDLGLLVFLIDNRPR